MRNCVLVLALFIRTPQAVRSQCRGVAVKRRRGTKRTTPGMLDVGDVDAAPWGYIEDSSLLGSHLVRHTRRAASIDGARPTARRSERGSEIPFRRVTRLS